jgi:hypothetical protein
MGLSGVMATFAYGLLQRLDLGISQFIQHLAFRGLNRVGLAKAATVLRRFLGYAFEQEWCGRVKQVTPAMGFAGSGSCL